MEQAFSHDLSSWNPLPQSSATAPRHSGERSAGPGPPAPSAQAAAGWGRRVLLPDLCPEQPLTVLGSPRDSAAAARSHGNWPCTGSHAGFPRLHGHRLSLDRPLGALCGHLKFRQSQAPEQGDQRECGRQSPNCVHSICVHSTQIRRPAPARLRAACPDTAALPRSGAGRAAGVVTSAPAYLWEPAELGLQACRLREPLDHTVNLWCVAEGIRRDYRHRCHQEGPPCVCSE